MMFGKNNLHHYGYPCPKKHILTFVILCHATSDISCPTIFICIGAGTYGQKHLQCYCPFLVVSVVGCVLVLRGVLGYVELFVRCETALLFPPQQLTRQRFITFYILLKLGHLVIFWVFGVLEEDGN